MRTGVRLYPAHFSSLWNLLRKYLINPTVKTAKLIENQKPISPGWNEPNEVKAIAAMDKNKRLTISLT
ncbi:hypothetical protein [Leadbetterella byssophila]|uniref:hypothetical protein n=1 Tax=Leadbetterella byssophila TaxID=316068 RepID=UPI0039A397BF